MSTLWRFLLLVVLGLVGVLIWNVYTNFQTRP
jgi:cytoskeletal protein RodZ